MNKTKTLMITAIETSPGIDVAGTSMIMTYGKEWVVTARRDAADVLSWHGTGECPWRVNQQVRISIEPLEEEQ